MNGLRPRTSGILDLIMGQAEVLPQSPIIQPVAEPDLSPIAPLTIEAQPDLPNMMQPQPDIPQVNMADFMATSADLPEDTQGFLKKAEEVAKSEEGDLGSWFTGLVNDEASMGRLIVALNSMRMNPDQGVQAMGLQMMKGGQAKKKANRTAKAVAQYLRQQGLEDQAQLVEQNPSMALDVYKNATKGSDVSHQLKAVVLPDGTKAIASYNPKSDTLMLRDGSIAPAGTTLSSGQTINIGGGTKLTDLNAMRKEIRTSTKPYSEPLRKIESANVLLQQAKGDSGQAQAQLDRFLATLAGDKQLSQAEVQTIVQSGSLPTRVGNTLSRWVTGVPMDISHEEAEEVIRGLHDYYAEGYNETVDSLKTLYKHSPVGVNVIEDLAKPVVPLANVPSPTQTGDDWLTAPGGIRYKVKN